MSVELLDKIRKMNRLLRDAHTSKVVFDDICEEISILLQSNMLVISKKGKVLGSGSYPDVVCLQEVDHRAGEWLRPEMNAGFLSIGSTCENVKLSELGFSEAASGDFGLLLPIVIAGERLGTVLLYRGRKAYEIEDIILCEYSTTVVGLELMRSVREEDVMEQHKRQLVRSAIGTLTGSEFEAIRRVLEELPGDDGVLVAGKIAERYGMTRSVIVNAIRKFESAGIMESHSSGMKGTHIRLVNEFLREEVLKK